MNLSFGIRVETQNINLDIPERYKVSPRTVKVQFGLDFTMPAGAELPVRQITTGYFLMSGHSRIPAPAQKFII